ncbi:MAG: DUF4198 domain-containing protein [Proteobacteria bacterium]|nr:DUF4198 domain-containing protein [Pseudomonadota bacterium]
MIIRLATKVTMALLLLGSCEVFAHDLWLTSDGAGGRLKAQINFGDTDDRQMPDIDKVVSFDLVSAGGRQDLRKDLKETQRLGKPVLETQSFPSTAGGVLSVAYDNGFWLKAPHDSNETNTSTLLVPDGTARHWTVKYGKTLLGPGSFENRVHCRLELVALQDPFKLAAGQKLTVRLELDGKPLAGAKLGYGDGVEPIPDAKMPTVTTGKDGTAAIPISRKGPYVITADPEVPARYKPLAEFDHLYASLAFDLSK